MKRSEGLAVESTHTVFNATITGKTTVNLEEIVVKPNSRGFATVSKIQEQLKKFFEDLKMLKNLIQTSCTNSL